MMVADVERVKPVEFVEARIERLVMDDVLASSEFADLFKQNRYAGDKRLRFCVLEAAVEDCFKKDYKSLRRVYSFLKEPPSRWVCCFDNLAEEFFPNLKENVREYLLKVTLTQIESYCTPKQKLRILTGPPNNWRDEDPSYSQI